MGKKRIKPYRESVKDILRGAKKGKPKLTKETIRKIKKHLK